MLAKITKQIQSLRRNRITSSFTSFNPIVFSELASMTGTISGLGVDPLERVQLAWIDAEI
jgi:hypothetical protein